MIFRIQIYSDYHFLKYLSLVRALKFDDIDAEMFPSKQYTVFLAVLLKDIWYKAIFSQIELVLEYILMDLR